MENVGKTAGEEDEEVTKVRNAFQSDNVTLPIHSLYIFFSARKEFSLQNEDTNRLHKT